MDRVPDELRTEVRRDIVQEAMIKTIPKKKKCKKAQWLFPRKTYKQLRKEEKRKAKEKKNDTPN